MEREYPKLEVYSKSLCRISTKRYHLDSVQLLLVDHGNDPWNISKGPSMFSIFYHKASNLPYKTRYGSSENDSCFVEFQWVVAIAASLLAYNIFDFADLCDLVTPPKVMFSSRLGSLEIKLVSSLGRHGHCLGLVLVSFFGEIWFFSFWTFWTMLIFFCKMRAREGNGMGMWLEAGA